MKYVIIPFLMLFASITFAMEANEPARVHEQNVQRQLKATPEMDEYCKDITEYYARKVKKYQRKLELKPTSKYYIKKLEYYTKQLNKATDYCTKPEGE